VTVAKNPAPRTFAIPETLKTRTQFANARPVASAASKDEDQSATPVESDETPLQSDQEAVAPSEPAPAAAQGEPAQPTKARKPKKKKANFYQTAEDEARAQAAWQHTMGHTGIRFWTEFVEEAVRQFTYNLEREYNDSKPFN